MLRVPIGPGAIKSVRSNSESAPRTLSKTLIRSRASSVESKYRPRLAPKSQSLADELQRLQRELSKEARQAKDQYNEVKKFCSSTLFIEHVKKDNPNFNMADWELTSYLDEEEHSSESSLPRFIAVLDEKRKILQKNRHDLYQHFELQQKHKREQKSLFSVVEQAVDRICDDFNEKKIDPKHLASIRNMFEGLADIQFTEGRYQGSKNPASKKPTWDNMLFQLNVLATRGDSLFRAALKYIEQAIEEKQKEDIDLQKIKLNKSHEDAVQSFQSEIERAELDGLFINEKIVLAELKKRKISLQEKYIVPSSSSQGMRITRSVSPGESNVQELILRAKKIKAKLSELQVRYEARVKMIDKKYDDLKTEVSKAIILLTEKSNNLDLALKNPAIPFLQLQQYYAEFKVAQKKVDDLEGKIGLNKTELDNHFEELRSDFGKLDHTEIKSETPEGREVTERVCVKKAMQHKISKLNEERLAAKGVAATFEITCKDNLSELQRKVMQEKLIKKSLECYWNIVKELSFWDAETAKTAGFFRTGFQIHVVGQKTYYVPDGIGLVYNMLELKHLDMNNLKLDDAKKLLNDVNGIIHARKNIHDKTGRSDGTKQVYEALSKLQTLLLSLPSGNSAAEERLTAYEDALRNCQEALKNVKGKNKNIPAFARSDTVPQVGVMRVR